MSGRRIDAVASCEDGANQQSDSDPTGARSIDQPLVGSRADSVDGRRIGSRGPLPKFSRDQIFRAALEIIDTHGREALTMRRLAEAMDTGTTTLYDYVKNKEELLQGVETLLIDSLVADLDHDMPWDGQLAETLRRLHAVQREHPGFVEVLSTQVMPGPTLDPVREGLMRILRQAGFSRTEAASVLAVVVSYVLGFSVTDRARVKASSEVRRMRELSAEEYPYLTDMAGEWAEHDPERAFEYGLSIMIGGLKRDLEGRATS